MFTTMEQCTEKIFSLRKIDQDEIPHAKMNKILHYLDQPQKQLNIVHVAGSNGKGSTISMLRALLEASGLRVGVFTSPHLTKVNERIVVDGEEITDEAFLRHMNRLDQIITTKLDGQYPSFFEVITLIGFMHFAELEPQIVLLETGLGGRLDATNVVRPLVSVITTISLEHTALLGNTHAAIAYEKAGIIKQGVPIISGVKNAAAQKVIAARADDLQAPYYALDRDFFVKDNKQEDGIQQFNYCFKDQKWANLKLTLQGEHQTYNAAVALTVMQFLTEELHFIFTESTARFALTNVQWAGRFEVFHDIILDGAHNVEGVESLLKTLQRVYPDTPFDVLYASLQDKDYTTTISLLEARAKAMFFTQIDMPHAVPMLTLFEHSKHQRKMLVPKWQDVLRKHCEGRLLVVTGSLYFVAEVRQFLMSRKEGMK